MLKDFLARNFCGLWGYGEELGDDKAGCRYKALRRNLCLIMLAVALIPLCTMALISHLESQKAIREEAVAPLKTLVNKARHTFEVLMAQRRAAVSFVASAYSFQELADQGKLEQTFHVMNQEFGGFVDLGLIDASGEQVSYVGPYELKGKVYKEHEWFQEVMVRGEHISDVFLGYRSFPHFVIAVRHTPSQGQPWILRASIDTDMFHELVNSMGLEPGSDAFVLNREGVLQTDTRFYGKTLEPFPLDFPEAEAGAETLSTIDGQGREILMVDAQVPGTPFVLMMIKPRDVALKSWDRLRREMLAVFLTSVLVVVTATYAIATRLVRRIERSEARREMALRSVEHAEKLASIGRLAAGVAHEINNPMAIINEKAGLMVDLVETWPETPQRDRFLALTRAIIQSVERCSAITHRLLGFARRMDTRTENVEINHVVHEVVGFLEREAFHRNILLEVTLADDLPRIESDHGQLQQVFLNILNNAFNAVDDGGQVTVVTFATDTGGVGVTISDNGCGMPEEVKNRIFEPFFTTRAEGTGLGLSITYGIVQKLGGAVTVDSHEGRGTTFTVTLPINPPTARS